jgi:hypothetical protein
MIHKNVRHTLNRFGTVNVLYSFSLSQNDYILPLQYMEPKNNKQRKIFKATYVIMFTGFPLADGVFLFRLPPLS